MNSPGPTHSGSPFVGRSREIGILTHLLEEGLDGRLGLVRVAGSMGSGRRRLIAESLNRGPDVEWVHLAPGGVEADLKRWTRTELIDLLDSYPDAPIPSWALHVLEPAAPALASRSAVPALSRERMPQRDGPAILGRALGTVLTALIGHTSVIVDAGLWPRPGDLSITLSALAAALQKPGTVMIAATQDDDLRPDPPQQRTLRLEALDAEAVSQLTQRWQTGKQREAFAAWLMRVTSGHPFYLQETARWLEELGHLRVHEEERRVEMLSPIERWPIPLSLDAVMDMRYRRLPPAALRLMHLIAQNDGRVEMESLRLRWDDEDSFEEGMTWLRRRDFLRDRSTRRPLALASPKWRPIARTNVIRLPEAPKSFGPTSEAPLARLSDRIDALTSSRIAPEDLRREISDIARRLRGRRGPAWDGARGRLAVHTGRLRLSESRLDRARIWVRWGLARTSPEIHPGLRRSLRALEAEINERRDEPRAAAQIRREAIEEALTSGHFLATSRLAVLVRETERRLGDPITFGLPDELIEKGMASQAVLAGFTEVAWHTEAGDLATARRILETFPALRRMTPWLDRLETDSTKRVPSTEAIPPGWTWGLGGASSWMRALLRVEAALQDDNDSTLVREQHEATRLGFLPLAAGIAESRIWRQLRVTVSRAGKSKVSEASQGQALTDAAAAFERLSSPQRLSELALRLKDTEVADHPLFPKLFGSYLLQAMQAHRLSLSTGLTLHFTGVSRVDHGGRPWPKALWPEWWGELWASAVSAALRNEPLDRTIMENRLRALGHLPTQNIQELVTIGNELFRGPERAAGGLAIREERIIVEWTGFTCDVRAAWEAFETAKAERDPVQARALFGVGLDHIQGPYLSGIDAPEVVRARTDLRRSVTEALTACLAETDLSATRWVRWLEGPVRMAGDREIAARFMERRGWEQAALALRRG